ncbi:SMP-30/gluconolactonase/LRE family protein [Sphingobium sp. AN641]|uniref:SMP-30/gluconolactonase/LRE family protein n=1 Tax=Sphingobium sp. AN641 TaxID=3133443 RepID=UPI0030BF47EF
MEYEVVTDGLCFPEGPVWMLDGSIILVEVGAGRITRVWPDGRKETVAEPGGGPSGAAIGPDGFLYVVNNGGFVCHERDGLTIPGEALPGYKSGWLDRIDIGTGKVERLYDNCEGHPLSAPNDIVFDYQGGIWFTDFGKHLSHSIGYGGLFYAKPDGSLIKRAVAGPHYNGIGLSPDRNTLYTAPSYESLLVAFDIKGPGDLAPTTGFVMGRPVGQFAAHQMPDSFAVLANGHVAVATVAARPGIASVNPESGQITNYPLDEMVVTNICFGGKDMQDAWITLGTTGRLFKTRWETPGLRLAHYS